MTRLAATLDQVHAEARELRPARVALTLVTAPLWVAGWLAGRAVRASWAVLSWGCAALVVGFRVARDPKAE